MATPGQVLAARPRAPAIEALEWRSNRLKTSPVGLGYVGVSANPCCLWLQGNRAIPRFLFTVLDMLGSQEILTVVGCWVTDL